MSGVSELIRALVAGLAVLAGGCTLVDQRTFRAAEAQAGVDEIARAVLPALPLIVVRFDGPIDRAAIAQAVELAQARREAAVFDVIAPIPTGASPAVQEADRLAPLPARSSGAPSQLRLSSARWGSFASSSS